MENKINFTGEYDSVTYDYKEQGNGNDSWVATYFDKDGQVVHKEMLYKDPNKPDTETTEKTLEGFTDDSLTALWKKLIDHMDKLPVELLDELAKKIPEKKQANPK